MIDDVLKDIREAEAQAEDMQQEAYQEAKRIVLEAEIEAQKQKRLTFAECKDTQKGEIALAEQKALEKREEILKKGAKDAEKLAQSKQKDIDEQADKLVEVLLASYLKKDEE